MIVSTCPDFPPAFLKIDSFTVNGTSHHEPSFPAPETIDPIRRAIGFATDLIASEVICCLLKVEESTTEEVVRLKVQIGLSKEADFSTWGIYLATARKAHSGIWTPTPRSDLTPEAAARVSTTIEHAITLARQTMSQYEAGISIWLSYMTRWDDLSNHQKINLTQLTQNSQDRYRK